MSLECIFCKIVAGEIPSDKVFEDDELYVFKDIHPQAPVHLLIIPKKHISSLADVVEEDYGLLGRMLGKAHFFASEMGLKNGFRTIINTGEVGRQDVFHLHIHLLGGDTPLPPMIYRTKQITD